RRRGRRLGQPDRPQPARLLSPAPEAGAVDPDAYAGFEGYSELVLRCVERVPRGRVTTYGVVADTVGAVLGRGGPRVVATVLRREGASVCWWRLVRADGSLPPHL